MTERKKLRDTDPMELDIQALFLLQSLRASELVQINDVLEGRCRTYTTLSPELRKGLDIVADKLHRSNDILKQEVRQIALDQDLTALLKMLLSKGQNPD